MLLSLPQSSSRRNGKVARLPFALRQQINQMIDDGLPYKTIIARLGEAGKHLNEDNLSNWRLGGFQDYLKAQVFNDRARVQTQAAADILRDEGLPDPREIARACSQISLLQQLETVAEFGGEIASEAFKRNPAKLITLINACCNMSHATIAEEKRKWKEQDSQTQAASPSNPAP
jgi:hypothetical protein